MADEVWIDTRDITIPKNRLRKVDDVEELSESIRHNGQLHPIIVRRDESGRLILVAGRRRIKAVERLRQLRIRARIIDANEDEAALIEIDENLMRAELNALDRATHIAQRKTVWESLHPETRHGGTPGNKGGKKGKAPAIKDADSASLIPQETPTQNAFTNETSKATGMSKRTVQEYSQIGTNLAPEAATLLQGTPVEDRKTDLLELSRMDKEEQVEVAKAINEGEAKTVPQAKQIVESKKAGPAAPPTAPPETAAEKAIKTIERLIKKVRSEADSEEYERFRSEVIRSLESQ